MDGKGKQTNNENIIQPFDVKDEMSYQKIPNGITKILKTMSPSHTNLDSVYHKQMNYSTPDNCFVKTIPPKKINSYSSIIKKRLSNATLSTFSGYSSRNSCSTDTVPLLHKLKLISSSVSEYDNSYRNVCSLNIQEVPSPFNAYLNRRDALALYYILATQKNRHYLCSYFIPPENEINTTSKFWKSTSLLNTETKETSNRSNREILIKMLLDSKFPLYHDPHKKYKDLCTYQNLNGIGKVQVYYIIGEHGELSYPYIVLPKMTPYDIIRYCENKKKTFFPFRIVNNLKMVFPSLVDCCRKINICAIMK